MESLGIQGQILTASSGEEYTKALRRNSDLSILEAKFVVLPAAFSDIPPVLAYAASQFPPFEIAVKGGGAHSSTWASSQGGVVIDLGRLNAVTIAADKQSVVVQGGAFWGDVYEACQKAGVDVVGGPLWFVGVGGFLVGGGYGPLSGERGLAVDNLLGATVVLADGHIVKTSAQEEPDLFWAIRGGGNQFGIVVEFTLKAFPPAGPFTVGALVYPGSEIANVLKVVQEWKKTHTAKERLTLTFSRPPPHFNPVVLVIPWVAYDTDTSRSKTILAPFRDGAVKPLADKCVTVPDMLAVSHGADASLAAAPRRLTIRGAIFSDFWTEMVLEVWERWCAFTTAHEDARGSAVLWDLTTPDKFGEVGPAETALNVRVPHYWMAVQGRSHTAATDAASRAFVASTVAYVREKNTELAGRDLGIFMNLAQGSEKAEDVFGANLPRLRKLKAKYDPKKLWGKGFVIEPDFD